MLSPAAAVWRPIVTEIVRERIGAGEPTWLPVHGRSMWPLLSRGTRILVADAARIRIGDLLAYECEGAIVCHRVLGRRGHAFLTRADHRGAEAERVMPAQIVGIVVALERAGVVIDLTTRARRAFALVAAARSIAAAGLARSRRRWWRRS
jgi:hypothetical protein